MRLYIDTTTASGQWLWKRPEDDPEQPTMIRIAAILGNENVIAERFCCLITPLPGAPFITADAALAHGISHDDLAENGRVLGAVLHSLIRVIERADAIIAHSADFHMRVLRRAFRSGEMKVPQMPPAECTMRRATDLVRVQKQQNGRWKWPRLAEAYTHFAGYGLSLPANPVERGEALVDAVRLVHTGLITAELPLLPAS